MKDYNKEVEYLSNYLQEKCYILHVVAKKLTEQWEEFNVVNEFVVKPQVIYYNKSFRVKVLIESVKKGHNVIFYSRQDRISVELMTDRSAIKEAVQDFVLSVMGDLMERGMESLRRKVIIDKRENMYYSEDRKVPGSEIILYPLTKEESTLQVEEKEKSQDEPSS